MARFLFLVRNDGDCPTTTMSPEEMQRLVQRYMAWVDRLSRDKNLLGAEKLRSDGGRVLREGKGVVKDGPFSETKEVIGGFWLVEARDYDHAVALAEGLPFGAGTLEIREIEEG
jgi:hypothetical protein